MKRLGFWISCLVLPGLILFAVSGLAKAEVDPIIDSAFHPSADDHPFEAVPEILPEVTTLVEESSVVCDRDTCPLSPRIDLHDYTRESPPSNYLLWRQQGYICWIPPERGEGRWEGLEGWIFRPAGDPASENGTWEWGYQKKCHPWQFIGVPRPLPYFAGGGICAICGKPWKTAAHQLPQGIHEYRWNPLEVSALNLAGIDDGQLFGDSSVLNEPVRARSLFPEQWKKGPVICRGQCVKSRTR